MDKKNRQLPRQGFMRLFIAFFIVCAAIGTMAGCLYAAYQKDGPGWGFGGFVLMIVMLTYAHAFATGKTVEW